MLHCWKLSVAIFFGLLASQATADCSSGRVPFVVCDIADKDTILHVCYHHFNVTHRYGVSGEVPQLFLSEPVATVDYHPWDVPAPTSGAITFRDGEYAYEVASLFVTQPSSDDISSVTHFGWATITRNGEIIDKLECRPEPSRYVYGGSLYEQMTGMGLEWNGYKRGWS